jgi:RecB family exonuclease
MSESQEKRARDTIHDRIMILNELGIFNVPVETEVDVELQIDGNTVSGIVDGIELHPDSGIIIRDWKSSIHEEFYKRYEKQLQFYTLQKKQVSSAQLVDVSKTIESKNLFTREINIDPSSLESIVTELRAALKGILEGDYRPNPKPETCFCCDMSRLCAERVD